MDNLLAYMLKIILVSGMFIGYYWLALRNKRFHYFNRFYLLASLLLSLLIPFLRFDLFTNSNPAFIGSGQRIDLMVVSNFHESNAMGIGEVCILLMVLVSILMITISGYHIYKIYRLKKQSHITPMNGFDLVYTDEEDAPFSFLDNLFWKRSISIDDECGKQIFKHELTHIKQKHTWDRLFSQLNCSIFWINPFFWIIQKELETIHEFIADEAAVGNEDVESFARMLLQSHYGNHFFETTHNFFYSSIKRRLTMLTKNTNTRFSYLRRVMLLPLLLICISLFSIRVNAKEKIEMKIHAISEFLFQKKIDTSKKSQPVHNTLTKGLTRKHQTKFTKEDIDIIPNHILYVVNDSILGTDKSSIGMIKPSDIKSLKKISDPATCAVYGTRGANGVILISTKK